MDVEMIPVSSSNIAAISYDEQNETVQVQFLNGTEYVYKGVPQHEFDGLLNAPSVGSYLNRNYKNFYPYERIS
ncbi:KTSC domain-containing protein [Methylococcaceae bacterium CS1]|nr:KTSC domain-containing protein [Methylococcaceae bacterium CS5]TXK95858.1 KTSC domain-containing protein [Methylococcaceae bacterium CS4]TXL03778.1 KTSC domain-containing protein [Methylococcaceae bacterium CS1]TXL05260.1 KTSC domain-containing protein [Methylococcaceae bacterium CS3]TXL08388.1 KTSC domain-containing protein [Methylococcaceae bacterium CS2]